MFWSSKDARHASPGAASRWAVTPTGLDTRTVMAAERTFLAWIRTCLTLLATGATVSSFPVLPGRELREVVGLACVVAVIPVVVVAHAQWREWCRTAAHHGLPRPRRTALLLLSVVLLVTTTLAGAVGVRLVATHRSAGFCRRPALCGARA